MLTENEISSIKKVRNFTTKGAKKALRYNETEVREIEGFRTIMKKKGEIKV